MKSRLKKLTYFNRLLFPIAALFQRKEKLKIKSKSLIIFILIFFYFFGLYTSFNQSFTLSYPLGGLSDTVSSILLWTELHQHGLSWIKTWVFPQDNFLFSLLPFHFLSFWLLGPKPIIPIIFGWIIFVASAAMTGIIAHALKTKHAPYLLPMIFLYAGLYAQQWGFVAYPVCHNITNLFGLILIWTLIRWTQSFSPIALIFIFILQLLSSLSDPWALPTYIIPTALTACFLLLSLNLNIKNNNQKIIQFFILLSLTFLSLILKTTAFFGLLSFLSPTKFIPAPLNMIQANAFHLLKDLGNLFNLWPYQHIPIFHSNLFASFSSLFIIFITFFIFLFTLKIRSQKIRSQLILEKNFLIFLIFSLCSVLLTALAFSISIIPYCSGTLDNMSLFPGRYLINIFYLVPIIFIIIFETQWSKIPTYLKFSGLLILFFYLLTGFLNLTNFIAPPPSYFKINSIESLQTDALINYLKKQKLNYGYGAYWGAHANAVNVYSHSKIIIRPVIFDLNSGEILFRKQQVLTSSLWFTPSDWPKNQKDFFMIISNDGISCANTKNCLKKLSSYYGPPIKIFYYQEPLPRGFTSSILLGDPNLIIAVWDRPLLSTIKNN